MLIKSTEIHGEAMFILFASNHILLETNFGIERGALFYLHQGLFSERVITFKKHLVWLFEHQP